MPHSPCWTMLDLRLLRRTQLLSLLMPATLLPRWSGLVGCWRGTRLRRMFCGRGSHLATKRWFRSSRRRWRVRTLSQQQYDLVRQHPRTEASGKMMALPSCLRHRNDHGAAALTRALRRLPHGTRARKRSTFLRLWLQVTGVLRSPQWPVWSMVVNGRLPGPFLDVLLDLQLALWSILQRKCWHLSAEGSALRSLSGRTPFWSDSDWRRTQVSIPHPTALIGATCLAEMQ